MKIFYLRIFFVLISSLILNACGSGASTPPSQQLTIASDKNVFIAKIGESSSIAYQVYLQTSPKGQKYSVNITLPNNQFSIEHNDCIDFYDIDGCSIIIKFSPTNQSAYSNNNIFQFSVGILESYVVAITTP